jgi:hypothetical protein
MERVLIQMRDEDEELVKAAGDAFSWCGLRRVHPMTVTALHQLVLISGAMGDRTSMMDRWHINEDGLGVLASADYVPRIVIEMRKRAAGADVEAAAAGHSTLTVAERFWAKVDMSGGPDACWPYTGAATKDGYGVFRVDSNGTVYAHRFAYANQVGPIPEGMDICHDAHGKLCTTRRCCNWTHLAPGTHPENARQVGRREKRWGGEGSTLTEGRWP